MFKVILNTSGAAFQGSYGEDEPQSEIARILRKLADKIEDQGVQPGLKMLLRDVNGNTVGAAVYTKSK